MTTLSLKTIDVDTVHSLNELIKIALFRGITLPHPLTINSLRSNIKEVILDVHNDVPN